MQETGIIRPITADLFNLIDQPVLLVISVYPAITAYTGKRLSRLEGISYLVLYVGYATYLFIRKIVLLIIGKKYRAAAPGRRGAIFFYEF